MATTARVSFLDALEAEIWRNAVEEQKFDLDRGEVEEIGQRVGLNAQQAACQFLQLAGDVWVGWIHPVDGGEVPAYEPQRADIEWTDVVLDRMAMERMGKIPQLDL